MVLALLRVILRISEQTATFFYITLPTLMMHGQTQSLSFMQFL